MLSKAENLALIKKWEACEGAEFHPEGIQLKGCLAQASVHSACMLDGCSHHDTASSESVNAVVGKTYIAAPVKCQHAVVHSVSVRLIATHTPPIARGLKKNSVQKRMQ